MHLSFFSTSLTNILRSQVIHHSLKVLSSRVRIAFLSRIPRIRPVQQFPANVCNSSLNFDKTYFLQFRPKNSYEIDIKIICDNKLIKETKNTKFLALDIDSCLSWKDHIDQMMSKLSRACYASRYVKHFMSQDILRTIYFSYFHPILSYGIIFWGNSAYSSNFF